jgi:hypothetical protein
VALVLALRAPPTEVSAALVARVWRRDDIVVLCRVCEAALVSPVHGVVRVGRAPEHADDIFGLALAVGDLARLGVLAHLEAAADPTAGADAAGPAEASACVVQYTLANQCHACLVGRPFFGERPDGRINVPSTSVCAISQPTLPLQSVLSVSCMYL